MFDLFAESRGWYEKSLGDKIEATVRLVLKAILALCLEKILSQ